MEDIFMKKHLLFGLAVGLATTAAMAQVAPVPAVANASTTATDIRATTATGQLESGTGNTTSSAAVPSQFAADRFKERWQKEEQMYKDAGLSEEKIEKLRQLSQETWNARAGGEKIDFQDLKRKRAELLDAEDMKKLREVRRQTINETLEQKDGASTAPASAQ
jgi:hypothetical protein